MPSSTLPQADHIEQVVSAWTGVPVERMSQDDRDRLLTLPDVLKVGGHRRQTCAMRTSHSGSSVDRAPHSLRPALPACPPAPPLPQPAHPSPLPPLPCPQSAVIGQDDAVESTSRAIMRASSGLKNPDRPIATLLFSGPTGVGKTELTKVGGWVGAVGAGGWLVGPSLLAGGEGVGGWVGRQGGRGQGACAPPRLRLRRLAAAAGRPAPNPLSHALHCPPPRCRRSVWRTTTLAARAA